MNVVGDEITHLRLVLAATSRAHLTELRTENARWLLKHSTLPIHEIARRSGYTSANYFNLAFKAKYGMALEAWMEFPSHQSSFVL